MKKLLFRIVLGFTLGITTLMVAYLGIYYIAGQEAFTSVISQLTDVDVFQNQLLVLGFSGIMMSFSFYVFENNNYKNKPSVSEIVIPSLTLILCFIGSALLIENLGKFDEMLKVMLVIVGTILLITLGLFFAIRDSIDELILNKKLKEKNG